MQIYKVKEVLSEKERKSLIRKVHPLLIDNNKMSKVFGTPDNLDKSINSKKVRYPGKQTHPDLDLDRNFEPLISKIIKKAEIASGIPLICNGGWITETNGIDVSWHIHPTNLRGRGNHFSISYYIKMFPMFSNGTVFMKGFSKQMPNDGSVLSKNMQTEFIKTYQNSFIMFPRDIPHTNPKSPLRFSRYVMALDVGIRR